MEQRDVYCKLFPPNLIKCCGHVHLAVHALDKMLILRQSSLPLVIQMKGQCWEPALFTAGGILESLQPLQVLLADRATFLGEETEDAEIRACAAWALSCDRSRLSSLLLVPS